MGAQSKLLYGQEPFVWNDMLLVPDGDGGIKEKHDPLRMAELYLLTTESVFREINGFFWVPTEPYYNNAKAKLISEGCCL